jgi:hypothetical protein
MGFLPTTKYKNNERIVSGSVNVGNSDMLLNVDTSLVACTINLQSIPNDYWNTLYKLYVKDISGNAGTNNITIVAPSGYKINNQQTLILNTNYESILIRISSNLDYVSFPNKAGHIIQDEGVTLPQQPILDFVGSGVTVTNGVGKTIVTIPQGITQAYTTVQNEGTSLPQRNIIDFVGTGVTASDNGTKTIVTINDCCDFVELTNSQMLELISNGTVDAGTYYKITNPINADEGVIVQGIVTNSNPSLQGSGIFLNADYQNVGDYSGVSGYVGNLGIWSSVVQTVVVGNVVIWGNRHWKNVTGNWGSSLNETTLDDSWSLLPKSITNGYIREIDFIKYNVNTNLVIYRADKRLNEVDYYVSISDSISLFQWGRDVVKSNKVFSLSGMQCTNSYCSFYGNYLTNESLLVDTSNINSLGCEINSNILTSNSTIYITNNTGFVTYNTLNKATITIVNNNGNIYENQLNASLINITTNAGNVRLNSLTSGGRIDLTAINYSDIESNSITNKGSIYSSVNITEYIYACSINGIDIFPQYFTESQNARTVNLGYSNFTIELSLNDTNIYDLGTQTLTIPHEQFGLIRLINTNSYIISKIINLANQRNTRFTIDNNTLTDTYVTFQHTVIASANNGDLVCDAPSSANVLVGRYFGSDFIEYQMNGDNTTSSYVNLRTNLVKLA